MYDGDKGDKVSLDLRGPYSRVFSISSKGIAGYTCVTFYTSFTVIIFARTRKVGYRFKELSKLNQ